MAKKHPIHPRDDRVLIRPDEGPQKSLGGLFIPDSAQEEKSRSVRGVVVAVGPGFEDEPIEVKPGDHVLYRKFSGHMVVWENEELILMEYDEVLAKLED